jgi:fumarate hydratase, class II
MDATPIRLGQEFGGFAAQVDYCVMRAERAMIRLAENLPIGGTAVGTGINTHPEFGKRVSDKLAKQTKFLSRKRRITLKPRPRAIASSKRAAT